MRREAASLGDDLQRAELATRERAAEAGDLLEAKASATRQRVAAAEARAAAAEAKAEARVAEAEAKAVTSIHSCTRSKLGLKLRYTRDLYGCTLVVRGPHFF